MIEIIYLIVATIGFSLAVGWQIDTFTNMKRLYLSKTNGLKESLVWLDIGTAFFVLTIQTLYLIAGVRNLFRPGVPNFDTIFRPFAGCILLMGLTVFHMVMWVRIRRLANDDLRGERDPFDSGGFSTSGGVPRDGRSYDQGRSTSGESGRGVRPIEPTDDPV